MPFGLNRASTVYDDNDQPIMDQPETEAADLYNNGASGYNGTPPPSSAAPAPSSPVYENEDSKDAHKAFLSPQDQKEGFLGKNAGNIALMLNAISTIFNKGQQNQDLVKMGYGMIAERQAKHEAAAKKLSDLTEDTQKRAWDLIATNPDNPKAKELQKAMQAYAGKDGIYTKGELNKLNAMLNETSLDVRKTAAERAREEDYNWKRDKERDVEGNKNLIGIFNRPGGEALRIAMGNQGITDYEGLKNNPALKKQYDDLMMKNSLEDYNQNQAMNQARLDEAKLRSSHIIDPRTGVAVPIKYEMQSRAAAANREARQKEAETKAAAWKDQGAIKARLSDLSRQRAEKQKELLGAPTRDQAKIKAEIQDLTNQIRTLMDTRMPLPPGFFNGNIGSTEPNP